MQGLGQGGGTGRCDSSWFYLTLEKFLDVLRTDPDSKTLIVSQACTPKKTSNNSAVTWLWLPGFVSIPSMFFTGYMQESRYSRGHAGEEILQKAPQVHGCRHPHHTPDSRAWDHARASQSCTTWHTCSIKITHILRIKYLTQVTQKQVVPHELFMVIWCFEKWIFDKQWLVHGQFIIRKRWKSSIHYSLQMICSFQVSGYLGYLLTLRPSLRSPPQRCFRQRCAPEKARAPSLTRGPWWVAEPWSHPGTAAPHPSLPHRRCCGTGCTLCRSTLLGLTRVWERGKRGATTWCNLGRREHENNSHPYPLLLLHKQKVVPACIQARRWNEWLGGFEQSAGSGSPANQCFSGRDTGWTSGAPALLSVAERVTRSAGRWRGLFLLPLGYYPQFLHTEPAGIFLKNLWLEMHLFFLIHFQWENEKRENCERERDSGRDKMWYLSASFHIQPKFLQGFLIDLHRTMRLI